MRSKKKPKKILLMSIWYNTVNVDDKPKNKKQWKISDIYLPSSYN